MNSDLYIKVIWLQVNYWIFNFIWFIQFSLFGHYIVGDFYRSMSVPIALCVENTDAEHNELSCSFDLRRTTPVFKGNDMAESPPSSSGFLTWVHSSDHRFWELYVEIMSNFQHLKSLICLHANLLPVECQMSLKETWPQVQLVLERI